MGIITISLDNKSEKKLRDSAKLIYGDKKGAISKTIMLAIKELNTHRKQNIKEALKILNNPIEVKNNYELKKLPTRKELWNTSNREIISEKTINKYEINKEKENR